MDCELSSNNMLALSKKMTDATELLDRLQSIAVENQRPMEAEKIGQLLVNLYKSSESFRTEFNRITLEDVQRNIESLSATTKTALNRLSMEYVKDKTEVYYIDDGKLSILKSIVANVKKNKHALEGRYWANVDEAIKYLDLWEKEGGTPTCA